MARFCWPRFKTTTILALGILAGCLLFTPMIALLGRFVPAVYVEVVQTIAETFRDGLFIVLGFYFGRAMTPQPGEST